MSARNDPWLPTRRTLLSRLRDWDDHKSWRQFFNTYWKLIYAVARQAGLSDSEAQEVVQETVITVAKQMPDFKYDRTKGSFKSWLRKTTHWRIQDALRKRRREQQFQAAPIVDGVCLEDAVGDDSQCPFEALWQEEWEQNLTEAAINRVKCQVSPKEYQVFDFCTVKGWRPGKVADHMHLMRAQVYYLNQKVARLIRTEVERLKKEAE